MLVLSKRERQALRQVLRYEYYRSLSKNDAEKAILLERLLKKFKEVNFSSGATGL